MHRSTRRLHELPIPAAAIEDGRSREMIRAWIANKGLHVTINLGTWREDEAIAWGILLSDVARHVSDALEKQEGTPAAVTLSAIRKSFNYEVDRPTSETQGGFVE